MIIKILIDIYKPKTCSYYQEKGEKEKKRNGFMLALKEKNN